ncbi:MAG: hypothetical protein A3G41_06945 [Elusimicrobia bacterium RIFCSPLOWO2_12_FULL_59_9]|nr:MAG: hypothetical protein A3G41_06945 [Elusimicrobia bacterium RIFCSPLOWO2_12_FULL_59_9]
MKKGLIIFTALVLMAQWGWTGTAENQLDASAEGEYKAVAEGAKPLVQRPQVQGQYTNKDANFQISEKGKTLDPGKPSEPGKEPEKPKKEKLSALEKGTLAIAASFVSGVVVKGAGFGLLGGILMGAAVAALFLFFIMLSHKKKPSDEPAPH